MIRSTLFAIAIVASIGCMSAGNFRSLPKPQQDRFQRCFSHMRELLCGTDQDAFYLSNCRRMNMADYSEQTDEDLRNQWLIAHGCPPSMVKPQEY